MLITHRPVSTDARAHDWSCEALTKLVAYGTSVRNVEYTDGYDAYVERVKMRHGKIISGYSMIGDERRGLDYGFDHVPS